MIRGVRYKNGNTTSDYYFTCNWRGDVVKIYDATGSFVANYDYDAWGNVISVTNENGTVITSSTHIANVNPIRYRGYYYDSETGLYYINSRYYDPQVKRFVNSDDDLLWNRPSLTKDYFDDVTVVFGHTPTVYYGENFKGKAIKTDTWIDVDVGVGLGLNPMLLRLDDLKEFYFDENMEIIE